MSITDAGQSHSEDMHSRLVKYSVAMGIRMICLVALFFLPGWWKIAAIIGAVFLPWVAVIIANGGDVAEAPSTHLIGTPVQGELESGLSEPVAAPPAEASATAADPAWDRAAEPSSGPENPSGTVPDEDGDVIEGSIVEDTQEGQE